MPHTRSSKGSKATAPSQKRESRGRKRKSFRRNNVEEGNDVQSFRCDNNHNNDNEMSARGDDEEPVETLIEPLPKKKLIDLLLNAADKHQDVADRIRMVADEDLVYRKILVYGLRWDTNAEMLINAFKPYGEIESCIAVTDTVSGMCKGYGFILFKSRSGAHNALKKPHNMIGNQMTACQLVPQKLVASPRPREEAARTCAWILAEPYKWKGAEFTRIRVDSPEPIEVELNPQEYNIYEEELQKMYIERVMVDLLKDGGTIHHWCTIALGFHNKRKNTDYVLVEPVIENLFYAGGCPRFAYHVNFKAKKQNEDDRYAVMFFAEMEPHGPAKSPTVLECTILSNYFLTHCRGCSPRLKIRHPDSEFYANRQIRVRKPMLSAWDCWDYLSQDSEVKEDDKMAFCDYNDNQTSVGGGEGDDRDEEPIETITESLPKEHLINLLHDAADKHQDLADQIRMVADEVMVHREILVYGLGFDTSDEILRNAFRPYGEIKACIAVSDEFGTCIGYGFILFESRIGACNALKEPLKRIGNWMAKCQLAPQKCVYSTETFLCSMEKEARAYAQMRAKPIERLFRERMLFRFDFLESMEVELGHKAKKRHEDDMDAAIFFAEMVYCGEVIPPTVVVCKILNTEVDIQTYCRGCSPILKMKHPVGGFAANCQTDYEERKLEIEDYLCHLYRRLSTPR